MCEPHHKKPSRARRNMLSNLPVHRVIRVAMAAGWLLVGWVGPSLAGTRAAATPTAAKSDLATQLELGQEAFARGALAEAVTEWRGGWELADKNASPARRVELLVNLATAYHWLGQSRLSLETS